jgi:hypothetical protein
MTTELDAKVARKLGWKDIGYWAACDEPGTFREVCREDLDGVPPYSTDIRAALTLLPKSGPVTMVRHASGEWVVGTKHYGSAMTLPEAICRWFLHTSDTES